MRAQSAFGSAGRLPSLLIRPWTSPTATPQFTSQPMLRGRAFEAVSTGVDEAGFFHIENPDSPSLAVACTAPIGEDLLATGGRHSGDIAFGANTGLTAVGQSATAVCGGDVEIHGSLRATSKSFVIEIIPLIPAIETGSCQRRVVLPGQRLQRNRHAGQRKAKPPLNCPIGWAPSTRTFATSSPALASSRPSTLLTRFQRTGSRSPATARDFGGPGS